MLLMKKDMGGAAAALALADMIMGAELPVRLRVLDSGGRERHLRQRLPSRRHPAEPQGHLGRDRQHGCGRPAHPRRRPGARRRGEPGPDRRFRDADRRRPRGARPRAAAVLHRRRRACRRHRPARHGGERSRLAPAALVALPEPCSIPRSPTSTTSAAPWPARSPPPCSCAASSTAAKAHVHFDIFAWNSSTKPGRPEGGEVQAARLVYALLKERYGA